jgi:predicted metal-dependent peptidase
MSALRTPEAIASDLIKKAHVALLRHPATYLYSSVLLLGETHVDAAKAGPTACTDGVNTYYNPEFMASLPQPVATAVVLHENLHKFLKHLPRYREQMKANPQRMNAAMDYVVNGLIADVAAQAPKLVAMTPMFLHDPMFKDWSVGEVYKYLKDDESNDKPKHSQNGHDQHDTSTVDALDDAGIEEMTQQITETIQQAAVMAGTRGLKLPRAMAELLMVEQDWREVLADFFTEATAGQDESTYRAFNRRRLVNGLYLPSKISERPGRVVVAFDTSGSISNDMLQKFGGALASLCEQTRPEEILVLWWDTAVHGVQCFDESSYANLASLLKPAGGGGTRVGCVSQYLVDNHIDASCVVVFTDGYVERDISWQTTVPALWVITERDAFTPPAGRKVKFK